MATYDEVTDRWHDRLMGHTDRANLSNPRMPVNDDAICSYGSHFPLVVVSRDTKRRPRALILNGDRWPGVVTNRHQGIVRSMAVRSPLPHVIVPFGALQAAGVDPADVEIIDVTPDRTEVTRQERYTLPAGTYFNLEPVMEWLPLDDDDIQLKLDHEWEKAREEWAMSVEHFWEERTFGVVCPDFISILQVGAIAHLLRCLTGQPVRSYITSSWASVPKMAAPERPTLFDKAPWRDPNSNAYEHHWGGWDKAYRRVGYRTVLRSGAFGNDNSYSHWSWTMSTFDQEGFDGLSGVAVGIGAALMCFLTGTPRIVLHKERHRHWLGGSLLRAKVRWNGWSPCKDCVDGLVGITRAEWREREMSWDERDQLTCPTCQGRGRRSWSRSRTAYFVSDFDAQEPRPLYFFCELPKGAKPTTLAEAIEALKPDPVLIAEQMERPVHRQGDIFAIELKAIERKALKAAGAKLEKMGELLGTNHVATEVAYLPDGTTVARGTLHHKPHGRQPDHIRHKLGDGKTWHVVVKNTVPVAA